MTPSGPSLIYKIMRADLWQEAQEGGVVPGMPIDLEDGYMHFSTASQLRETLRLHFRGQADLMLLGVPVSELGDDLRWEPSRGGELFPHLYGPLRTDQITLQAAVSVDEAGVCNLPALS